MKSTNSLTVGDHIPNFNLKSIEGANFSISEIIGKNNLILHFYKSIKDYSCTPNGTGFSKYAKRLNATNTKLVAISSKMSTSKELQDELTKRLSTSFDFLRDDQDELRSFFGLCESSDPLCNNITFVVDQFGKIKAKMDTNNSLSDLMDNTIEVLEEIK